MRRREFLALAAVAATGRAIPGSVLQSMPGTPSAGVTPDAVLRIQPVKVDLAPKVQIETLGYNGLVPGPVLRFKQNAPVNIDVYNETAAPEVVHWHGLAIDPINDGAMEEGSPMIAPGGHLRYSFRPNPAGSRWYHTHTSANEDLSRATYSGQFGFLLIEPKMEPGNYDQEILLAIHHWQPRFTMMGPPMNAKDVDYEYASFNDKLWPHAEPISVREGQRILFRFLNASATRNVTLAMPGHLFTVIAMDGNPVPQPRAVETLALGVAERIDAIVEMNSPGVWLLGSTDEHERTIGLARTIEYSGKTGAPVWAEQEPASWDYFQFANSSKPADPDVRIPMVFSPLPAGADGFEQWMINGKGYSASEPLLLHKDQRYRLVFVNGSAEFHPLHLHRHSFELVSLGGTRGSGLMKDVVTIPPNSTMEVDFIANNPGDTLFHCHQQLHMDYGFMQLLKYAGTRSTRAASSKS
jgi:FtsP/CotA-like multicopper oxidase with cupredoxin domain